MLNRLRLGVTTVMESDLDARFSQFLQKSQRAMLKGNLFKM